MEHLPIGTVNPASFSLHAFDSGATMYFFFLLVFLAGIILYIIVLYLLNLRKKLYFATITFPEISELETVKYIEKTRVAFDSLFKRIHNPLDKIFLEVIKNDAYITLQIGSNNTKVLDSVTQIFSQIENCKVTRSGRDILEQSYKLFSRSIYTSQTYYPITKQQYFFDTLIHFLDGVPKGESAGIQFVIRGVRKKLGINWRISGIDEKRKREKRLSYTAEEEKLIGFYAMKRSENIFKTKIRVFASSKDSVRSLSGLFSTLNFDDSDFCSQPSL
ncbi:MAG: hypothetical protein ACREHC_01555, partial [Candidatus Levyibacteriota bacterium]